MANLSEPDGNNSFFESNLRGKSGINFWFDQGFTSLIYVFAAITVAVLFVMSWVIYQQAKPAVDQFGLGFLWSNTWNPGEQVFGALPYIYGTLVSSAIAIFLAVPIGILIALVTSENFLPISVKTSLAFVVELIAAIPSIIIGLWEYLFLFQFSNQCRNG